MCVAGKIWIQTNSWKFYCICHSLSLYAATSISEISKANMSEGGWATIPATATSKRFNRQWRRLSNGHIWWNYLKRPSYASEVFCWIKTWQNTISRSATTSARFWRKWTFRVFFLKQMTWVLWHIFVLYQGAADASWTIQATFWRLSFTTSWHGSTTGWEIWRRKQFTPQGSIIRARRYDRGCSMHQWGFQTQMMENEREINAGGTFPMPHIIFFRKPVCQ